MTINSSWPFKLDHVNTYAFWEKVFTKEECERIISIGSSLTLEEATIKNQKISLTDYSVRESNIAWLSPNEETTWIYQRIADVSKTLNDQFFQFDLFGIVESIQFTKYKEPEGKYTKHIDTLLQGRIRKLSVSVQLSDPTLYSGGDLNLYLDSAPTTMKKDQGCLIIFPSYVLHEVTSVTQGERHSLVSWITGSPFK